MKVANGIANGVRIEQPKVRLLDTRAPVVRRVAGPANCPLTEDPHCR